MQTEGYNGARTVFDFEININLFLNYIGIEKCYLNAKLSIWNNKPCKIDYLLSCFWKHIQQNMNYWSPCNIRVSPLVVTKFT